MQLWAAKMLVLCIRLLRTFHWMRLSLPTRALLISLSLSIDVFWGIFCPIPICNLYCQFVTIE
jgi:hypothetical protein